MKKLFTLLLAAPLFASATTTYEDFGSGIIYNINVPVNLDMDGNGQDDFVINGAANSLEITPIFAEGCYDIGSTGTGFIVYGGGESFVNGSTSLADWEEDVPATFWDNSFGVNSNITDGQDFYIRIMLYNVMKEGFIHLVVDDATQTLRILDWMYTDDFSYEIGSASSVVENPLAFQMYPNPVNSVLTIESSEKLTGKMELVNALGQVCITKELSGIFKTTLDASAFEAGIYFIRITKGDLISNKRIVIK
ncbi:MAG: hypothetical protein ACI9J3_001288 [Parvicellaceae bacterium]|jgi:hypothetical protein